MTDTERGKLALVGIGPGAAEHMTPRAQQAIDEADVVIGYKTYIKLVSDRLEGKEVIRKGMTEEVDRVAEAAERAQAGANVALISSGDAGIYGMAAPALEYLAEDGGHPERDFDLEFVPGVTALTACANLVGAPLGHDFCSISLSDLLTDWETIAARLKAAAEADFAVALYNPKSGKRTEQIRHAQRILMEHRPGTTPVALVKSAYRKKETVVLTDLASMLDYDIGMLTTVLIGNRLTYRVGDYLITPRGYTNKYDLSTGEAHAGQTPGSALITGPTGERAAVDPLDAARQAAEQEPTRPLPQIARDLDAPEGTVVRALAGTYAWPAGEARPLIDHLGELGRTRAVVRNGNAVSEFFCDPGAGEPGKAWWNLEHDAGHIHIRLASLERAHFVARPSHADGATSFSVQFFDADDEPVIKFFLPERGDWDSPAARAWADLRDRFAAAAAETATEH